MPVTWERRAPEPVLRDPFRDMTRVQVSPSYDFLISLRALYNPRSFENTRAWAASARAAMPRELYERGRFFFHGHDTGLGYGAARLVVDLPADAPPEELIKAVRTCDPRTLVLYMIDT